MTDMLAPRVVVKILVKKYFDAGHVSIVFREPLDVAVLVHEIIYLQEIRNVLKRFSNVRVEFEEKPDAIGKPYMYP
jgi:hypothetical protein